MTSALRNDTSLLQLLLSQGRDGADVTGPAGIIIHIFVLTSSCDGASQCLDDEVSM